VDTKAADAAGGQLVTDSYAGLKTLLQRKLGDGSEVVKAIEAVEVRPDSAGRKETLKEEIAASKLDQDEEIVAAVQRLLDNLKQHPEGSQIIQQASGSYIAQAEGGSTANVQVDR
jgi:hypothetical protein